MARIKLKKLFINQLKDSIVLGTYILEKERQIDYFV